MDPKRILELWIVHLRYLGNQKAVDIYPLLPDKNTGTSKISKFSCAQRSRLVKMVKKTFAPCSFPHFLCSIRMIEAAKGMLALLSE